VREDTADVLDEEGEVPEDGIAASQQMPPSQQIAS